MSIGRGFLVSLVTTLVILGVLAIFTIRVVPPVVGLSPEAARVASEGSGLRLFVANAAVMAPDERVSEQSPAAGSFALTSSTLAVKLSVPGGMAEEGKEVAVPPLAGAPLATARYALESVGLVVGEVQRTTHPEVAADSVVRSMPPSGAMAPRGSQVVLVLSTGPSAPEEKEVPKVVGRSVAKARRLLDEAGFKLGDIRYQVNINQPFDRILDQRPRAGVHAPAGSDVSILVNTEGQE